MDFAKRVQIWHDTRARVQSGAFPPPKAFKAEYDEAAPKPKRRFKRTYVEVVDADTIVLGSLMAAQGLKPLMLVFADHRFPGGDVEHGSGAQEESLFRRTTLCEALAPRLYPIFPHEAIVCKDVWVLRDVEAKGCRLLSKPYMADFIAAPGIQNPALDPDTGLMGEADVATLRNKVRLVCQCALAMRKTGLVLGPLGCGAWRCPPRQVAEIFKEVIAEYDGAFHTVLFACLEVPPGDHIVVNRNRESNFKVFQEVFKAPTPPPRLASPPARRRASSNGD